MSTLRLCAWSRITLTGLLLLLTGTGVPAADDIAWNLTLLPSADGSHSGRILVTPTGQLHEGPGHTGKADARYHFHARDEQSGGLGVGIPVSKEGETMGEGAGPSPLAPIDGKVEEALVSRDWKKVVEALMAQDEPFSSPVAQLLMGHAFLMLNRNNESFLLLWTADVEAQRRAWETWTADLVRRLPNHAIAHYLHGDAVARLQNWQSALVEFNTALRLDPTLFLARNARAVVWAVLEHWDETVADLIEVTEQAPDFVDGHLNLGTYWIARRAPEGGLLAFEKALKISPSFLAYNGHGCAQYGLGKWEQASKDFAQAGQSSTLAFVLRNLRAVTVVADAAEQAADAITSTSPLFRPSDFFDWTALREATNATGDLLRDILRGRPLPAAPEHAVIEALNTALEDPTFYEKHKDQFDLTVAPQALLNLLEETKAARHTPASALSPEEKEKIRRLNRLLIELTYPSLIAQHDARTPGMQIVTTNGLLHQMNPHLMPGAPPQLRLPQHQMNPHLMLGTPPQLRPPQPLWNPQLNQLNQFNQLNAAIRLNNHIFTNRGPSPLDLNRANGVIIDVRRAYVDKGNWDVEAPFGLAYFAPLAVTTD